MLFLLVQLPDGTMTVRRESEANAELFPEGGRYVMPDGKEGVVVQELVSRDDHDPAYPLLREISDMVLAADDASDVDPMEVLGGLLHEVRARGGEEERNKWMEEKAKLVAEFNETAERLLRNQSKCVLLFQESRKRDRENEKLRRKHKNATALIRAVVEEFRAIGLDVKFVADDGVEVPATPPENSSPQPNPPATDEVNTPPNPDPKSVETEG